MRIKSGVNLLGLQPQMVVALIVAESVFAKTNIDCVITSAVDSTHGTGSLHYQGLALDFRIKDLSDPGATAENIRERLGVEYDVVLEDDHIHVEFQPKKGVNR